MARASKARMAEEVAEIVIEKIGSSQMPTKPTEPQLKIDWRDLGLAGIGLLVEALALLYGVSVLTLAAAALFWFAIRGYRRERKPNVPATLRFHIVSAILLVIGTTVIPIGIKILMERRAVQSNPIETIRPYVSIEELTPTQIRAWALADARNKVLPQGDYDRGYVFGLTSNEEFLLYNVRNLSPTVPAHNLIPHACIVLIRDNGERSGNSN
jgi:hypothetical protein